MASLDPLQIGSDLLLVHEGTADFHVIGQSSCFRERGGKLPDNMDKARAQAFLSTRPKPHLPVGLAATEGYWDFASLAFTPLVDFLRGFSTRLEE